MDTKFGYGACRCFDRQMFGDCDCSPSEVASDAVPERGHGLLGTLDDLLLIGAAAVQIALQARDALTEQVKCRRLGDKVLAFLVPFRC